MIPTSNINNFNLYIIQSVDIIKIGFSEQMSKRLSAYKHHNPNAILLYLGYNKNAYQIEQKIHNSIESAYLREWYQICELQNILNFLIKNDTEVEYIGHKVCQISKRKRVFYQKKQLNVQKEPTPKKLIVKFNLENLFEKHLKTSDFKNEMDFHSFKLALCVQFILQSNIQDEMYQYLTELKQSFEIGNKYNAADRFTIFNKVGLKYNKCTSTNFKIKTLFKCIFEVSEHRSSNRRNTSILDYKNINIQPYKKDLDLVSRSEIIDFIYENI